MIQSLDKKAWRAARQVNFRAKKLRGYSYSKHSVFQLMRPSPDGNWTLDPHFLTAEEVIKRCEEWKRDPDITVDEGKRMMLMSALSIYEDITRIGSIDVPCVSLYA
jgi:hypothetical protein